MMPHKAERIISRHAWGIPTVGMGAYILVIGFTAVHKHQPLVTEPIEYGWDTALAAVLVGVILPLFAFLWGRDVASKSAKGDNATLP